MAYPFNKVRENAMDKIARKEAYETAKKVGQTPRGDGIHVGAGRTPGSLTPTPEERAAAVADWKRRENIKDKKEVK
jgi:hypothetical protein